VAVQVKYLILMVVHGINKTEPLEEQQQFLGLAGH